MLVVVSDTHGRDGPQLAGRTREAVATADLVIHAGDFTTLAAYEGFRELATRLVAVHGNADGPATSGRLPPAQSVAYEGVQFAVTHRRDGGEVGLRMFGRQRGADVVVFGHTHRPTVLDGDPVLLNPGSHADPRGNRPGHAELEPDGSGLSGAIYTPDGDRIESIAIRPRS